VEIVRALLTNPQLLILDEPTSVLTPQAVDKLFVTLRQLADKGCSILYISHKLDEIRALCHHCTVLRGGKVTGEVEPRPGKQRQPVAPDDRRRTAEAADPQRQHRRRRAAGAGLSLQRQSPFGTDLHDIELEVRAGEIVGMAGVSGNGQQELMAALSGEDARAQAASIGSSASPSATGHRSAGADWACTSCPKSGWAAAPCPSSTWPRTPC
jgi:ABC-type uncharacterized transport system ATPase subunit